MIVRLKFNIPRLNGISILGIGWISKDAPERTEKHEEVHNIQWRECFYVGFPFIYYWQLFRHGYKYHPMELDAWKWENDIYSRPPYYWLETKL